MDRRLFDDDPAAGEDRPTHPLPRARPGSVLYRREGDVPLTVTPEEIARAIASYAEDRKALEIVELDLREMIGYTDYFVICSGRTDRQVKAIHDAIHAGMKNDHGMLPRRVEGLPEAHWVLMDYLDVLVHIFTPDTREYYRLEQLWGEAPARTLGTPATATP
ncbi:MAG TPA: ribosome silencing factor [Solirubrobacteraceae bacterium]|jgi:ribosome-associated protein|nr:ribosome silencing factor [Solirubrobacteraceae bacterium]